MSGCDSTRLSFFLKINSQLKKKTIDKRQLRMPKQCFEANTETAHQKSMCKFVSGPCTSSYPRSPNLGLCPEAVVDCVGKPRISIHCSCPSAWLWVSIVKNAAIFNALTSRFTYHDQSRPMCISLGAVCMTMGRAQKVFFFWGGGQIVKIIYEIQPSKHLGLGLGYFIC